MFVLEHVPPKCEAVWRQGHAQHIELAQVLSDARYLNHKSKAGPTLFHQSKLLPDWPLDPCDPQPESGSPPRAPEGDDARRCAHALMPCRPVAEKARKLFLSLGSPHTTTSHGRSCRRIKNLAAQRVPLHQRDGNGLGPWIGHDDADIDGLGIDRGQIIEALGKALVDGKMLRTFDFNNLAERCKAAFVSGAIFMRRRASCGGSHPCREDSGTAPARPHSRPAGRRRAATYSHPLPPPPNPD